MTKEPPFDCNDPSTWRHKGEKIDLTRLLQLIEENGGPEGLDLHWCEMIPLDARPEALRAHIEAYARKHGKRARPPWLGFEGESINLSRAHLEDALLTFAHLESAALWKAHLERSHLVHTCLQNAVLIDAHLENADLASAELQGAHLGGAHLQEANLTAAHLQDAHLVDAHLQKADLTAAHLDRATWYGSHLDHTHLRREQLGPAIGDELAARGQAHGPWTFHGAREAYMTLKTNFGSIGRYDDASWAYVKEGQMEKAMHFPTTAGHEWIRNRMDGAVPPPWWGPHRLPRWFSWKLSSAYYHSRLFLGFSPEDVKKRLRIRDQWGHEPDERLSRRRWARNWVYELLSGYGERPHMPPIWAVVVIVVFAGIYAAAGNIASGDGGGTHDFLTALTHSIGAFATIGFNTLEPQGWGARLLTAIEAMLGIGLFALFVFTLGNRMRRS